MIQSYETTFIVDAHLSNEQIESLISKYSKVISDNTGTIKLVDRWGKRRLAYEIAKKQYGYYVYIRFDAEGTLIKILDREFKLDDHVIRYLTVVVPKKVVEKEGDLKPKSSEQGEEEMDSAKKSNLSATVDEEYERDEEEPGL